MAKSFSGVASFATRRRRLRRGGRGRRDAERGHLLVGLVEPGPERAQGPVLLLERRLELLSLLGRRLGLAHQERGLRVEGLELAGQASHLAGHLVLALLHLVDLLDQRGHLGLAARLLPGAAAGHRQRQHREGGQPSRAHGEVTSRSRHALDRSTSILEKSIFTRL